MKKHFMIFLALLVAVAALSGCGEKNTAENNGETGTAQTGTAAPGTKVASVNGEEITSSEVDKETNMMLQQMGGRMDPAQLQSMGPTLRKQAFSNIVNRILLRQAAEREGIDVTESDIDMKIEEIKGNFPSEEAFTLQLQSSGLSDEDFKKEIKNSIKIETLIEKLSANLEPSTDETAKAFYESNTDRFRRPEQIRASHVLVKVEPSDTEEIKTQKRKKIEDIRTQILGGGDFTTIASEQSDCPSSASGGDLGFFGRGQMVKPFEDAAFALRTGEISPIVETRFGYHVIKVTERQDETTTAFDDVKSEIIVYLDGMKKQAEVEKYVAAMLELAKIEYTDSSLVLQ